MLSLCRKYRSTLLPKYRLRRSCRNCARTHHRRAQLRSFVLMATARACLFGELTRPRRASSSNVIVHGLTSGTFVSHSYDTSPPAAVRPNLALARVTVVPGLRSVNLRRRTHTVCRSSVASSSTLGLAVAFSKDVAEDLGPNWLDGPGSTKGTC